MKYYKHGAMPQGYAATATEFTPVRYRSAEAASVGSYFIQPTGLGASMLSNNEKKLASIAVIGLVGYVLFGKKIKKALKA